METVSDNEGGGFALQACDRCRVNKKKCDRLFPVCTTCEKKLIKCSYGENRSQLEIRMLRSQLEHLANRKRKSPYLSSPNQITINPIMPYPIPSRWYMPFLVDHCKSCGYCTVVLVTRADLSTDHELQFPSFARNEDTDIDELLRAQWMQASLSDPCMFHGILFAASSHLDILRGEDDNPVTQYHRRHAIRLLLDHISSSQRVSVTAVATAMYLWHYEAMSSNMKEGDIHKQGLRQMVKANGGIGAIRLCGDRLSNLIILIDIGDSILSATKPMFCIEESCHHCEAPTSLISNILRQSDKTLRESGIDKPLVSLLRKVHHATLDFECELWTEPTEDGIKANEPEAEGSFSAALTLAAMIHLNSLHRRIMFSADDNQALVEKLRLSLASLPQGSKFAIENEIYVFLCFTGAATARENKAWFLAKAGPVVMSLNQTQLHHFKMAITRFGAILQKLEGAKISNRADMS